MNVGLPAAVAKDLFGRDGGGEDLEDGSGDLHSCQSGRYREEDVGYVIDGELAAGIGELGRSVGELGRSVGSRLDR